MGIAWSRPPAPPPPARSVHSWHNNPCSIWDGTSMPPKATGRRCVGASRRSSAANCNWSPPALESHAQHSRPVARPTRRPQRRRNAAPRTTFSKSMWTPWNSASVGVELWDCGRWTSSGCARACRNHAPPRLDHRAHGRPRRTRRWLAERSALDERRLPGSRCTLSRLRRADGAPRSHRAPSVRPGDGPVRPAPHGHALRPDQYLLRRRGGRATQGPTRTLQGKTHRLSAPYWGWCSMPAASCVAHRSSPATCANITRWPRCSTRSTPRAPPWW